MTQKRFFLISLLFAFFGIQSINAQSGNRTIIFQGYAENCLVENFWQCSAAPGTTLPVEIGQTYGILLSSSDDGSDDSYRDAGLNFECIAGDGSYIYDYTHVSPDFNDEGDLIRFSLGYDGFDLLQTDNGIYIDTDWFNCFCTTRISFKIYQE